MAVAHEDGTACHRHTRLMGHAHVMDELYDRRLGKGAANRAHLATASFHENRFLGKDEHERPTGSDDRERLE
jgi:hypothetical protein